MNRYADLTLFVSTHAHKQYCDRVEAVEAAVLETRCREQMLAGDHGRPKDGFVQIGGVWWYFEKADDAILLVTCYGKTTMDLPAAIRWLRRQREHDNINLSNMIVAEVAR